MTLQQRQGLLQQTRNTTKITPIHLALQGETHQEERMEKRLQPILRFGKEMMILRYMHQNQKLTRKLKK